MILIPHPNIPLSYLFYKTDTINMDANSIGIGILPPAVTIVTIKRISFIKTHNYSSGNNYQAEGINVTVISAVLL